MCKIAKLLTSWIRSCAQKPIRGFDHKTNPDGSLFNYYQQKNATHTQLYNIILDMKKRGKDERQIVSMLTSFR
jgi:hypothetical protein